MNQENKFGEYWDKFVAFWKKFAEYLRIFFSLCAAGVKGAWGFLWRNARALLQTLAFFALAVRDKAKTLIGKIREHFAAKGEQKAPALEEHAFTIEGEEQACEETPAEEPQPEPAGEAEQPAEEAAEEEMSEEAPADAEAEQEEKDGEKKEEEKKPEKPPIKFDDPNKQKAYEIFWYTCKGLKFTVKWAWKLRTIFMAIPVLWTAIKLAMQNMDRLPEQVGLDIQATGEFARMISRTEAVYWPLGITVFCLVLMFVSKKPMLPWVISMFTLILPWLIWILNYIA